MMPLTLYSKKHCHYCEQAKALLTLKNIAYIEVKIDEDDSAKAFILSEGHRTVPQIYDNGVLYVEGGFVGLQKMFTKSDRS